MVSRKRPAADTLPPLRPTKQSRQTTDATDDLLSKWSRLFQSFRSLGAETWDTLVYGPPAPDLPTHYVPSSAQQMDAERSNPSHRPSTAPGRTEAHNLPTRSRIPLEFRRPTDPAAIAPPPQPRSRSVMARLPPATMDPPPLPPPQSQSLPQPEAGPSRSAVNSPTNTDVHPASQVAAAARRGQSRQRGALRANLTYDREHIFADQHKRKVEADRAGMLHELYALSKDAGYTSNFSSFRELMSYKQKLELINNTELLSPRRSMTDLRTSSTPSERNRRHSSSQEVQDLSEEFLARALQRAKLTISSPRPPKPFSPFSDKIQLDQRRRDEAIEARLRPKRPPLPPSLPPEAEADVKMLLNTRGVISKVAREQVSDKDLVRLRPGTWLNDEVINFYGALIQARADSAASKENDKPAPIVNGINGVHGPNGKGKQKAMSNGCAAPSKPLNVHYFSTFFWTKLKDDGYEKARLAKWTKKVDIFSKDAILIPINHNNAHWTAACIDFRRKRIEAYDSMSMEAGMKDVCRRLRGYLDAEHRNKKKTPFDFTGWADYTHPETPQQENGSDCGVFTCQFLESLSRGEQSFNFSQSDMPYLRRRMMWEVGKATLRDEW